MKQIISKYKELILGVLVMMLVTAAFVPRNFKNKNPVQSDISQYNGAASEMIRYKAVDGHQILWTNALFSGMPTYPIGSPGEGVAIKYLYFPTVPVAILHFFNTSFPNVWAKLFIYLLCSFIMLLAFGVRPWLAVVGAIGIGFATENLTIISVGHNSKSDAIGYFPLVLAGCQYLFRKKYLLGLAIVAAGLGLQIYVNHVQITYYGAFMVALFFVFQLIKHVKEGNIRSYMIAASLAALGAVVALGANSLNLMLLQEYAKESIRGTSALTISKDQSLAEKNDDGLNKDYVFSYSNGWSDIGAAVIPNYSGGDSDKLGLYYGEIGSTSGPKYIGAILFILMMLGLVLIKGPEKWWLVTVMILTIILSMGGNHFVGINTFMFEYFPMYSKFRAPSMMMFLIQFCVGLLAIMAVEKLLQNPKEIADNFKNVKYATFTGVGVLLILTFSGTLLNDFSSTPKYDDKTGQVVYDSDTRYAQSIIQRQGGTPDDISVNRVKSQLVDGRIDEMKKDGYRSIFLVLLALTVLWFAYKQQLKPQYTIALLGVLILFDMWSVGKRYLDDKDFKSNRVQEQSFTPYQADLAIQQDKSYYRVLDLTESPLNSNRCAYFHKSVGGYSAAKIRRFQDLWDWYLTDQLGKGELQNNNLLNMVNMKYFIYPNQQQQGGEPMYATNPTALGNAWILQNIRVVENADSAILALQTLDTKYSGVVEKEHEGLISKVSNADTTSTIKLTSYHPEKLVYEYNSATESNVAFSEVYYNKGWKAYIDGKAVDHFRLNYLIRGLKVPAGKHDIRFEYSPDTYALGSALSTSCGALIYVLLALTIFFGFKKVFLTPKKEA